MKWPSFSRWNIEQAARPWGDRPSILGFLDRVGRTSRDERELPALPDEDRVAGVGSFRWAPGASDGVGLYHTSSPPAQEVAAAVLSAIRAILEDANDSNLLRLYEAAMAAPAAHFTDPMLDLANREHLDRRRVARLGRLLTREGADREIVKLGIVLLAMAGDEADRQSLELLARHDEFTLFAIGALVNAGLASELDLWAIAQDVRGWGRVHVVSRLGQCTDPRVRRWLVREGFRYAVTNEYLALVCAVGGDLVGELAEERIDTELLDGAASLLAALAETTGGVPQPGFEAYPAGVDAVRAFFHHAQREAGSVEQLLGAARLRRFAEDVRVDWEQLVPLGWTEPVRAELAETARRVVGLAEWPDRIREGIDSEDYNSFFEASAAADELGMDLWEAQFARLRSARYAKQTCWGHVCRTKDVDRMDRLLAYAEETLPLDRIASGPASESGFGDAFRSHHDLDWVLYELRHFPGRGWTLLRAGLRSPLVRNRNMAVAALEAWPRESWPADARSMLETARDEEPEATTRQDMERVLQAQSLA